MTEPVIVTAPAASNRTVVVTGGTGGIGYHSAVGIARTGCRVIVTGRDRQRGEAAVRQIIEEAANPRVQLVIGDVSSRASIDALAKALLECVDRLDVLVNNAGYLGNEPVMNADNLEMHFAVNVCSPWRLTHALLPALRAAGGTARVVNLTAGDNAPGTPIPLDVDNIHAEKGFRGLLTMAHSKSVMECMSVALARELEPQGVMVNVVFPGRASTVMTRSLTLQGLPGPMKLFLPCMRILFRDDGGKGAALAARTTIWAATDDKLNGVTGRYFDSAQKERPMHPKAMDPQAQAKVLKAIEAASGSRSGVGERDRE